MKQLRKVDKVAYIRFASIYRDFRDAGELIKEVSTELRIQNQLLNCCSSMSFNQRLCMKGVKGMFSMEANERWCDHN